MAKILCIDDYQFYADMIALILEKRGGYEVKTAIYPLNLGEIENFSPDLILLNLVRKIETLGTALQDFYTEVNGAKALKALSENPLTEKAPLVVTAMGVTEEELPKGFHYKAFLPIPERIDYLMDTIKKIVESKGEGLIEG